MISLESHPAHCLLHILPSNNSSQNIVLCVKFIFLSHLFYPVVLCSCLVVLPSYWGSGKLNNWCKVTYVSAQPKLALRFKNRHKTAYKIGRRMWNLITLRVVGFGLVFFLQISLGKLCPIEKRFSSPLFPGRSLIVSYNHLFAKKRAKFRRVFLFLYHFRGTSCRNEQCCVQFLKMKDISGHWYLH